MKKTIGIFAFAAILLSFVPLYAQTILVPADTFPFGIFDISGLDGIKLNPGPDGTTNPLIFNKMQECGLNTFYSVNRGYAYVATNQNAQCYPAETHQTEITKNFPSDAYGSILGGDGSQDYFGDKYIGNRFATPDPDKVPTLPGAEVRHFLLPSNPTLVGTDQSFDYETGGRAGDANRTLNDPSGSMTSTSNSEWQYVGHVSERDLLNIRESKRTFVYTHQFGADGSVTSSNNSSIAYVDLIYRLDPNENDIDHIPISTTTNALFSITSGQGGSNLLDIHWSDYAAGGRDRAYHNENSNIISFADQQYAVARFTVNITDYINNPTFDVTLHTTGKYSIYVLGFRFRSTNADQFLSGAKDAQIKSDCQAVIDKLKCYLGSDKYNRFKAIGVGGELQWPGYRVYAYVDKIFNKVSGGKHLYPFLTQNGGTMDYFLYRAIYEDQNGVPPPNIIQESFKMFLKDGDNHGNPPYMPSDGIPSNILHRATDDQFLDLGFTLQTGNAGGTSPYEGYFSYTNGMQNLHTEVATPRPGYYDRIASDYLSAAQSAYPKSGKLTKWYSLLSSILLVWSTKDHPLLINPMDNSHVTYDGHTEAWHAEHMKAQIAANLTNGMSIYDAFTNNISYRDLYRVSPRLTTDNTWWNGGGLSSDESNLQVTTRGPFNPEMRAEAWCAISYGAKGIFFNPVGSDMGENIGIGDIYFRTDYDGYASSDINRKGLTNAAFGDCDHPFFTADDFDHLLIQKIATGTNNTPDDHTDYEYQWIPKDGGPDIANDPNTDNASLQDWLNHTTTTYNVIPDNGSGAPGSKSAGTVKNPNNWKAVEKANPCNTALSRWVDFYEIPNPTTYSQGAHLQLPGTQAFQVIDHTVAWPFTRVELLSPYLPTFYGFQERWEGAKRVVADISPIAERLAKLNWDHLTINLATATTPELDQFPIQKNIVSNVDQTSEKMWRYTLPLKPRTNTQPPGEPNADPGIDGSTPFDASDASFYHMGLFKDPNEDKAKFFTVSNRRMWPFRLDEGGTTILKTFQITVNGTTFTDNLLGAVDARRFHFTVKTPANNTLAYYSLTNLRTGLEEIKRYGDGFVHFVDLEPGEGTLYRVSPATSFPAGRTSDKGMAYNNGHRIAEATYNGTQVRIMTWVGLNGKIQYNIANNDNTVTTEDNFIDASNVLPLQGQSCQHNNAVPSYMGMNPSIATKNGMVAIIYNVDPADQTDPATTKERAVIAVLGTLGAGAGSQKTSITWQDWITLDPANPATSLQPDQLVTPSITPAEQGFFCAWSKAVDIDCQGNPNCQSHFIQPAYILFSGTTATKHLIDHVLTNANLHGVEAETDALMSIFPSVATREESAVGDGERLLLAWEEQWAPATNPITGNIDTNAHIYYTWIKPQDVANDNFIIGLPADAQIERVSQKAPSCRNNHPNIAVSNAWYVPLNGPPVVMHGEPKVTWEMKIQDNPILFPNSPIYRKGDAFVMTRERRVANTWNSFTAVSSTRYNMPLPLLKTGDNEFTFATGPTGSNYGLTFQDTFSRVLNIVRKHVGAAPWQQSKLVESGLYPNLLFQYSPLAATALNTLTFRGVDKDADGLYAARITARNTNPGLEQSLPKFLIQSIKAAPKLAHCEDGLIYSVGPAKGGNFVAVGGPDTIWFNWQFWEFLNHDSTLFKDSLCGCPYDWTTTLDSIWTNSQHIRSGDSLRIDRLFEIPDSSLISSSYFPDTLHSLSYEIDMKDSATNEVVQVLDKIVIKGGPLAVRGNSNLPLLMFPSGNSSYSVITNNPMPLTVPPSGSGYLSLRIRKDTLVRLGMVQTQVFMDSFVTAMPSTDSTSYKKGNTPKPQGLVSSSSINLTVHPNPFRTKTDIELEVPKDILLNVTVFDVLGHSVNTLLSNVSSSDHYSFTLDSKLLNPGMYYVRVQAGSEVITRKVELVK